MTGGTRARSEQLVLRIGQVIFGEISPPDPLARTDPPHYFCRMLSTLLVLAGVLVGLLVLLALIVSLSARPATVVRGTAAGRSESWVSQSGRPHPDAWAPLSSTATSEMPAVR